MRRYRRRKDVVWRRSLERVLVLRPGGDEITVVGGGGSAVWDLLASAITIEELSAALEAAHDAVPETFGSEVRAVLDDLVARDLVEVRS